MVQLEELDADAPPPDLEEIPGAELSARILACDGLWLASELALQEGGLLTGKGVNHLCVFGAIPDVPGVEAFHEKRRHAYVRAENGALITHLRKCCDFIGEAIAGDGQVAVLSEEEGEAGAAFLIGAYLILEKGDARRRRRRRRRRLATGVGYQGTQGVHEEFAFPGAKRHPGLGVNARRGD